MKIMTKREFQDGMNSILADYETKEKVWNQLCEKQIQEKMLNQLCEKQMQEKTGLSRRQLFHKNDSPFSLRKNLSLVATALLICAILIPGIVYADEIVNYFRGHLSQSPDLKSNVSQNVFEDGDEHVSMEVCELLSDGYATCMTVKYTALDEKGRQWLFGETLQDAPPMYRKNHLPLWNTLGIVPIEEESENEIPWSGSNGTEEIEQEQTKNSRVFSLSYTLEDDSSKRCLLTYPLYEAHRSKALTFENLLKTYTYALDGECSNENYTPKYLRISKIRFVVYGENHGVYYSTGPITEMISEEEIDSAALYFKNRSPLDLVENRSIESWMGAILEPGNSTCNMDLRVMFGAFYDKEEWVPFEDTENWYDNDDLEKRIDHRLAVDPEDVQKLEINGDFFTLKRTDVTKG